MTKPLKIALGALGVLSLALGGGFGWAALEASGTLSRTIETHRVDFVIPFPLSEEERAALDPSEDPGAVALERALERGRHLVNSRYVCVECHGQNFGGGVMIDDPLIGRLLGPNLTTGRGSRTLGYHPADWDRAVRHGVLPDGRPSTMPAEDFQLVSNQELADVVAYIRSMPPVDSEVPPVRMGPLGTVLLATGALPISADLIHSHTDAHPDFPPLTEVSAEFGRHLAGVCTGCHRADMSGGPIPGGDPSWPPARNLTPHRSALGDWTYEDFTKALQEGRRPDGTELLEPMTLILPYARNMTETETRALWTYLRSVPPLAARE